MDTEFSSVPPRASKQRPLRRRPICRHTKAQFETGMENRLDSKAGTNTRRKSPLKRGAGADHIDVMIELSEQTDPRLDQKLLMRMLGRERQNRLRCASLIDLAACTIHAHCLRTARNHTATTCRLSPLRGWKNASERRHTGQEDQYRHYRKDTFTQPVHRRTTVSI